MDEKLGVLPWPVDPPGSSSPQMGDVMQALS